METNHAMEQAKAKMQGIAEMVAALECDYARLEVLKDAWQDLVDSGEELAELSTAAGDCENYEEAYDRIQEDPLSVEVRSGWHAPGGDASPEEFMILLCTGGPAVRVIGYLDQHGQPWEARIEYQDWFTPWVELRDGVDETALLTYCQQFYFGEC